MIQIHYEAKGSVIELNAMTNFHFISLHNDLIEKHNNKRIIMMEKKP